MTTDIKDRLTRALKKVEDVKTELNELLQHSIADLRDGYENGACERVFGGRPGTVTSVAFSPDGKRIASGSSGGTHIYNIGADEWETRGHSSAVRSVAFSPDGTLVVIGSDDGVLRVYNSATGEYEQTFEGHSGAVYDVAFVSDGTHIVSGSRDKSVRVWNVESGMCEKTLQNCCETSVAFSPDGKRIACSFNETVRIYDMTGKRILVLHQSGKILAVAYSFSGTRIASGSLDGDVCVYHAENGARIQTLEGHLGWVTSVAFSSNGKRVVSGSNDKSVRVWNVRSGVCELVLQGHTDTVTSVAFSPCGTRVVSGSMDGSVRVWKV